MKKGVFITFEGGEGTGKSTQVALLQSALASAGVDVVVTREPGGTPQAERIRQLLLMRDSGAFDPLTEALLLSAARREHLVNRIWPALEKGQWVISDRFIDSTRAFQGYGMGLEMGVIDNLYRVIAEDFEPALTFIFDLDPAVGVKRAAVENRYELMGLPFHQRLRAGYLEIAKRFPARCVVIDAAQDIASIHRHVLKTVETRFGVAAREARHG